jgi:16S rRNA (guanine527-N7)-methyltransferase
MTAANYQIVEFETALLSQAPDYGVKLSAAVAQQLSVYYQLINTWNHRLHLVAPCSPEEFAQRHILESLILLEHLPQDAAIADIGSGAGLPIIPCLIARADLSAVLIESSQRKAVFLREALKAIARKDVAKVLAERFETVETPPVQFITSRALDRFVEILPRLIAWAPHASALLLFGGNELEEALKRLDLRYTTSHIPKSEQRFLFEVDKDHR